MRRWGSPSTNQIIYLSDYPVTTSHCAFVARPFVDHYFFFPDIPVTASRYVFVACLFVDHHKQPIHKRAGINGTCPRLIEPTPTHPFSFFMPASTNGFQHATGKENYRGEYYHTITWITTDYVFYIKKRFWWSGTPTIRKSEAGCG